MVEASLSLQARAAACRRGVGELVSGDRLELARRGGWIRRGSKQHSDNTLKNEPMRSNGGGKAFGRLFVHSISLRVGISNHTITEAGEAASFPGGGAA